MGGVVLGVEGDFQLTGIQDVEALMVYTRTINLDYFGTLRARAGVAMGSVMAYVTAGALVGQGTLQFDDGVTTYTDSQTHFGWSAGAGVEVAASDTVSIKGEVLYNDAGSKTYFDGDPLFEADAHPTFTIVRAGVNVHF
jgi:outer membrane immunogenic protein